MTWLRRITAAVIVITATVVAFSLPPAREPLAITSALPAGARGAIHVHTRRSDGTGTIDDVAAAAARAGLKFVILTDHGDGTRRPEPPSYRQGVLVIDAAEISTQDGHVVALGIGASPYPLGGEGRDVIEDIARLGGMSIVAHPASRKPDLQWLDWTSSFDGLEWLNGDSEWRDESHMTLLHALLTYPLRPAETLGKLLDRPEEVLRRWDELAQRRRVVAVAGADAHARLALRSAPDPYDGSAALRLPGYERVFDAFSIVIPQLRFSGDATEDAARVVGEIRQGHVFSSVDALATPAALSFTATSGSRQAGGGDVLPLQGPVSVRVASNAPANSTVTLFKDGVQVATSSRAVLEFSGPATPAVYRAEIGLAHAPGEPPVPWIVTNPIYAGRSEQAPAATERRSVRTSATIYDNGPATGWAVEASAQSAGAIDVARALGGGTQLRWRYALGGAPADGPYVALVVAAGPSIATADRVMFTARSDKPIRIAVQVRVPKGPQGERWQRSFYADDQPREITVFFDDLRPHGSTTTPQPVLSEVQALMWVLEPPHTALGTNGQVWLDDIRYGRP
jgi:hypothetical protein